jgi:hypothetical protein
MIRNLKVLGLALCAMLALGATAASSASAVDTFTSTNNPETITGSNPHPNATAINKFFITNAGGGVVASVECTTAKFHGNVPKGAKEGTFTATYSGTINIAPHTAHCSSSFGKAEVTMNGCAYILTGNTTGGDPTPNTDATVWVECTTPNEITVHFPEVGVMFEIPWQTPTTGGVTYTNTPDGKVDIKATVTGITYTCTPAFLCGLGGLPSEGNNADYTGTVLASGSGGNPISVTGS